MRRDGQEVDGPCLAARPSQQEVIVVSEVAPDNECTIGQGVAQGGSGQGWTYHRHCRRCPGAGYNRRSCRQHDLVGATMQFFGKSKHGEGATMGNRAGAMM